MSADRKCWVSDGRTFALVSAEDRDRLVPLGWTVTDKPTEGFVSVWRDGIEMPGRVTVAGLRDLWGPLGWVAGPPPGSARPATPEPPAEPVAESKPEIKPAVGGNAKEK